MTEFADYSPASWRGHDYESARSAYREYDDHTKRSYADAKAAKKTVKDLVVPALYSEALATALIFIDVTGSMHEWPKIIFSKLPFFELESRIYLGQDLEFAFGAIGDATPDVDDYPLQVRPFTKDADLETRMNELVREGGGGGQTTESYELAGLYALRNVSMPNAVKSIFIIIGDEQPYDFVDPKQAKQYARIEIPQRIPTNEVFTELKRKYAVYFVQKPYGIAGVQKENRMSDIDRRVYHTWSSLIGEDHIAFLPDPGRVIDVILGIFAKETKKIPYYRTEIEERQKPDQVKTAYKSLETIHAALPEPEDDGKKLLESPSRMHKLGKGKKSKPIL